jgi:hypothetical protein
MNFTEELLDDNKQSDGAEVSRRLNPTKINSGILMPAEEFEILRKLFFQL